MQSNEWYYTLGGTRRGPVSEDKMRELILSKQLTAEGSLVWCSHMDDWQELGGLEVFQPSLELINRREEAEKQRQANKKRELAALQGSHRLQKDHSTTQNSPESYLRRVYIWGAIRATIASTLVCLFFLWIHVPEGITSYLVPLPLGFLTGLCAGQYYPERFGLLFKSMAGGIAAAAFLFFKYSSQLIDQGAVVGENFSTKLLTTSPLETIALTATHFNAVDTICLCVTFITAFVMAVHGHIILAELARHKQFM